MKQHNPTSFSLGSYCNNELLQPPVSEISEAQDVAFATSAKNKKESSGSDNDYWIANITHPKRLPPTQVECEDLIELFQFTFAEGNAFKALWRKGMDRVFEGKPGDTPLRNAQKVAYYGARMTVMEERHIAAIEDS